MTSDPPATSSHDRPPDGSAARLIAIEFEGSTCHQIFGRHYHCANCGGGPTSQQGHLHGDPPAFACEQPWPEVEERSIVHDPRWRVTDEGRAALAEQIKP